MAKLVPLPTRSFGAEPGIPVVAALAGWVADHRGTKADLMAYQLDVSLGPQLAEGVTLPCAGGLFCRERVVENLVGLNEDRDTVTGEIDCEGMALVADAAMLAAQKKNVWCALPAPSALRVTDAYYGDADEWGVAIAAAYRRIMRDMRDAGIGGHVLIAENASEPEIAALARKNVFFFVPEASEEDLETLLEHQRETAVPSALIDEAIRLAGEYDIFRLDIVDPDTGAIAAALTAFDPDRITAGGYCTADGGTYWKNLVESAVYRK